MSKKENKKQAPQAGDQTVDEAVQTPEAEIQADTPGAEGPDPLLEELEALWAQAKAEEAPAQKP